MRRLATFALCAVLLLAQPAWSASGEINRFNKEVFPEYQTWFSNPSISAGHLRVETTPKFDALSERHQLARLRNLAVDWAEIAGRDSDQLIEIIKPAGGGLAVLPQGSRRLSLLGNWKDIPTASDSKNTAGRWFYYGGVGLLITGDAMNTDLGFKFGTYLFKNMFDVALSMNWALNMPYALDANYEVVYTTTTNLGLVGRMHFPLADKLSANVGAELGAQLTSQGEYSDTSGTRFFVTGLSYFMPGGTVDLTGRFGTSRTLSLGMTRFINPGAPKVSAPAKKKKIKTPRPTPQPTVKITQEPTIEPTVEPTPQPTATAVATATPQPEEEPEPEKEKEEEEEVAEATPQPTPEKTRVVKKKSKKKVSKKKADDGDSWFAGRSPRHRFLLGYGLPQYEYIHNVKDYFRNGNIGQVEWEENGSFGLEYAYKDIVLSARHTAFGVDQFLYNNDPMCTTGCQGFDTFYSFDVFNVALGWDFSLMKPARGFQFYVPLQLEATTMMISAPEVNLNPDPMGCTTCGEVRLNRTDLGLVAGLGIRMYAWRWLVIDASARWGTGGLFNLSDSGDRLSILTVASPPQANTVEQDFFGKTSGLDLLFRLGVALW